MSDSSSGEPGEHASAEGPGILAGLPRTRPQRASARRTAARAAKPNAASASSARAAGKRATARAPAPGKARATGSKPASRAGTRAAGQARAGLDRHTSAGERAPRQGFESEPDSLGPVQPPAATELISSAAELAGELAKAGVGTGARVLRELLFRLPG